MVVVGSSSDRQSLAYLREVASEDSVNQRRLTDAGTPDHGEVEPAIPRLSCLIGLEEGRVVDLRCVGGKRVWRTGHVCFCFHLDGGAAGANSNFRLASGSIAAAMFV